MKDKFPAHLQIKQNVPLTQYTNIKIGGIAQYLSEISSQDELIELFLYCKLNNLRMRFLGHGSNVFFSDNGFPGMIGIIKFDNTNFLSQNTISIEAGAPLSKLNKICVDHHLTGFEFSTGIPGTVGGAIYGNAGAYGKAIGECLVRAKTLTITGEIKWVDSGFFQFAYRDSSLKRNQAIVLEAEFRFEKGDPEAIQNQVNEISEIRRRKLPDPDVPTAGSYFKNLKDEHNNPTPAAKLLDAIGSKQVSVGDAAVFHKHANIFYNRGKATAQDLLTLEDILRKKVHDKFGILLEREVMYFE